MSSGVNRPSLPLLIGTLLLGWAAAATAQSPSDGPARDGFTEREQLARLAAEREELAANLRLSAGAREHHRATAWILRNRMSEGDFRVGDRIAVRVRGEAALTDTFTVRDGPTLQFPDYPHLPLRGVLRSELTQAIESYLARYLREPSVDAVPLVRLVVTGPVGRPGFYYTTADALLSDVIMIAGGPGLNANLERSMVRRAGSELWTARDVQIALHDGLSIDQFHLRGGDELVIGERRSRNWGELLRNLGVLAGLVTLVMSLS